MMKNDFFNSVEGSFEESSPTNISGEDIVDGGADVLASNDSVYVESGYYAGSQCFETSYQEYRSVPDVFSGSYFDNSGYGSDELYQPYGSYMPTYDPVPTYYYIYNVVTPIEYNGAVYYSYNQVTVPVSSYSFDEVVTENAIESEYNNMDSYQDFVNTVAEQTDENRFYESPSENSISSESNNSSSPPPEFLDEFAEYFAEERYSSQIKAENSLMAAERNNEIKTRKDWLYLLSLSGKLRLKENIPQVGILPVIIEEEEGNDEIAEIPDEEINQGVDENLASPIVDEEPHEEIIQVVDQNLESPIVDEASSQDILPLIDKSSGDQEKEYENDAAIEASCDNISEVRFQDRLGDKDFWDSMFSAIDEIETDDFGAESCFSGSSENDAVIEASCDSEYRFQDRLGDKEFWDLMFSAIDEIEMGDFKTKSSCSVPSENEMGIDSGQNDIDDNPRAIFRKVFRRLYEEDIDILPTILEEDEPEENDEDIMSMTEKIVVKPNEDNSNVVKEECFQQLTDESETDNGLLETVEAMNESFSFDDDESENEPFGDTDEENGDSQIWCVREQQGGLLNGSLCNLFEPSDENEDASEEFQQKPKKKRTQRLREFVARMFCCVKPP